MKRFLFVTAIIFVFFVFAACSQSHLDQFKWHDIKQVPCPKQATFIYERIIRFNNKTGVEAYYLLECNDQRLYNGFMVISNRGWNDTTAPGSGVCEFKTHQYKGKTIVGPSPDDPHCP